MPNDNATGDLNPIIGPLTTVPPIADVDEGNKDEEDQLAMLKLKYSTVRDRSQAHGPHNMTDDELRQLPSNRTLDAVFQ
jgi:hypothetical protein